MKTFSETGRVERDTEQRPLVSVRPARRDRVGTSLVIDEHGKRLIEGWGAASGGFVFALAVCGMGILVGVTGWAAARYTLLAILLGSAAVAGILGSAISSLVQWGRQSPEPSRAGNQPPQRDHAVRHAA